MTSKPVKKISRTIFKIVVFAPLILLAIAYLVHGLWYFFANLKVLLSYANNSLVMNSLINSSDTYLTFLQEIVISASMIFGFYAILLFYFIGRIIKFINKYTTATDRVYKGFINWFTFLFILLPFFLVFLSAFYSITATMIYRTPNLAYLIQPYVYKSVHMLLLGTGILLVNLIVFLVVRFWLYTLPKKYHSVDIFISIWYALILLVIYFINM